LLPIGLRNRNLFVISSIGFGHGIQNNIPISCGIELIAIRIIRSHIYPNPQKYLSDFKKKAWQNRHAKQLTESQMEGIHMYDRP